VLAVLALILAGWSSNSKYALLGGLRSSAQMVSYEVAMGLSLIGALMFARTLSLSGIVAAQGSDSIWYIVYQPAGFFLFLISGIAENNRAPFDLPEAESELVAGFHTEYSACAGRSSSWLSMRRWSSCCGCDDGLSRRLVLSVCSSTRTSGITTCSSRQLLVFLVKASIILYFYFWLRWTLPRFRYDQLMDIGWKWLIPSALINIVLSAFAIFVVQALNGCEECRHRVLDRGLNLTRPAKGS
jgi:NADH-quinone oxidoreductase subunit H